MNLRFKDAEGKNRFPHTFNGSGTGVAAAFCGADRIVSTTRRFGRIPEKLQPYFGATEIR